MTSRSAREPSRKTSALGGGGGLDPNVNLDPIAGVWNDDSFTSSSWAFGAPPLPDLIVPEFSPGVTLIHGFAEINPIIPSAVLRSQIVAGIGLPDVHFMFGFAEDELRWHEVDASASFNSIGPVTFTGGFDRIGWEADFTEQTLTAFFNDVQVGTPQDVSGAGDLGDNNFFFGSGVGGNKDNVWTRVVFGEGPLLGPPAPPPLDFSWKGDTSGDWNAADNWLPPGKGPPGVTTTPQYLNHSVEFGPVLSSTQTVFTNTEVSARQMTFDSEHGYAIAGRGSVSFVQGTSATLPAANIQVADGNHEFQLRVSLEANTEVNVASGQSLEFNNRLSLNNNVLTKTGEGTLAINNSVLTGGGTINCAQGTCAGTGTIGGDLNNDGGTVSPGNSSALLDNSSAVPEPSSLSLLVLTALALGAFRPRHPSLRSG